MALFVLLMQMIIEMIFVIEAFLAEVTPLMLRFLFSVGSLSSLSRLQVKLQIRASKERLLIQEDLFMGQAQGTIRRAVS